MCELSIISRGSRWILLGADDLEIDQFGSEADALSAATDYVDEGPAFVLVGDVDGEWREERLEPPALH
jgi:hypothetical protein